MQFSNHTKGVTQSTMDCIVDISNIMHEDATYVLSYIVITLTAIAMFVGSRNVYCNLRKKMAQLNVVVIGAGPIGLTSALIAVQCKRVNKLILYEEQSRFDVENRAYQIAIRSANVSFLRSFGIDFDNLEGIWRDGCFYTRVGIYLEYIIQILPLYQTQVELKFRTKFGRETCDVIDRDVGRKLVICCDGAGGFVTHHIGLSDEYVQHSSGVYGATAAIERTNQTLVPTPEKRIHNLSFDLSAYGNTSYEDDGRSNFTLKIFGNSRRRYLSLAVKKGDSIVVRSLKTVLDKSMMRNVFLKCFNTYKLSDEGSISDSYCLNNMKFSPRLFEIKLSQRIESAAYISDSDMFVTAEGESSRALNFNTGVVITEKYLKKHDFFLSQTSYTTSCHLYLAHTCNPSTAHWSSQVGGHMDIGMDINLGFKGVTSLQPYIEMITVADSEHSIMESLIFKMEHSDKICRDFLKHGLKEYMFL